MYIETSSPRIKGDNAILQLSVLGNGAEACLTFYYHMYGDTMGSLTVSSGNRIVFKRIRRARQLLEKKRREQYICKIL